MNPFSVSAKVRTKPKTGSASSSIKSKGVSLKKVSGSTGKKKVASLRDPELIAPLKKRKTRVLTVEEEAPPPKKKKRLVEVEPEPSMEVVTTGGRHTVSLTKKMQAKAEKKLVTMFGDNTDFILDALDRKDTDGAHTMIYQALLQTLVDIVPISESIIRKSSGRFGIYQFNQLVSQLRECLADVQATRDKGQIGTHLVDKFVRPSLLNIAAQVSVAFMEIEASAKGKMTEKDFQDFSRNTIHTLRHSLSTYMTQHMEQVVTNVAQSFS